MTDGWQEEWQHPARPANPVRANLFSRDEHRLGHRPSKGKPIQPANHAAACILNQFHSLDAAVLAVPGIFTKNGEGLLRLHEGREITDCDDAPGVVSMEEKAHRDRGAQQQGKGTNAPGRAKQGRIRTYRKEQ